MTLSDPKTILLAALLLVTAIFVSLWSRASPLRLGIGFLTDFLDTLGIGSFATTTTLFRLKKLVAELSLDKQVLKEAARGN